MRMKKRKEEREGMTRRTTWKEDMDDKEEKKEQGEKEGNEDT